MYDKFDQTLLIVLKVLVLKWNKLKLQSCNTYIHQMTLYHMNVRIRLNSYAPCAWLFGEFWGCFTRLIKCPQQHCNFYSCSSACSSFFYGDMPGTCIQISCQLTFPNACTKFTCWALCAFYLYQFQFVGTLHYYTLKSWYYRTSLVHFLLVYFIVNMQRKKQYF